MTYLTNLLNIFQQAIAQHRLLSALLAGGLFSAGFAPVFWWPLSLLAVAVLFTAARGASSGWQAFGVGYVFGLAHFLTTLWWIPRAFYMDFGSWGPALAAGVPATVLLCAYLALFPALAAGMFRALAGRWPRLGDWPGPVVFTALWLGTEVARSWLFTGFPWNLAGYVFADTLPVLQLAAFGHIWALSALAVFVGAAFATGRRMAAVGLAVLALVALGGYGRLEQAAALSARDGAELTVRLVQPNILQQHKWDPDKRIEHLEAHMRLSLSPAATGQDASAGTRADVIIWPETAAAFFLEEDAELRRTITSSLHREQTLVTGAPRRLTGSDTPIYYNSILALAHSGKVLDAYDKRLLVPFGEYVPYRWLMPPFVQKIVYGRADYAPGHGPVTLEVGHGLTALPLVCFEVIHPAFVARHAAGKDVIINVTNDGWFDGTVAPYQHLAMARVRAVEAGLPLIRAANTGISAVVDRYGRITARLGYGEAGVLDVGVGVE